jgi:hypothetical protein
MALKVEAARGKNSDQKIVSVAEGDLQTRIEHMVSCIVYSVKISVVRDRSLKDSQLQAVVSLFQASNKQLGQALQWQNAPAFGDRSDQLQEPHLDASLHPCIRLYSCLRTLGRTCRQRPMIPILYKLKTLEASKTSQISTVLTISDHAL